MFKAQLSDPYGCDALQCTFPAGGNGTSVVPTQTVASLLTWLDLFCVLAFLGTIPLLHARFSRLAEHADANTVTVADYTVMVWGIGADATQEQLRAHFAKYDGGVCPRPSRLGPPSPPHTHARVPPARLRQASSARGAPGGGAPPPARADGRRRLAGGAGNKVAPAPEDEAAAGGAAAAAVAVAAGPPGDAGPHGGVADVYVARRDAALLRAFVARSKLLNRKVALDKTLERTAALPAEDKRRVRAVKAAERNTADLARLDARQARAAGAQSPAGVRVRDLELGGGQARLSAALRLPRRAPLAVARAAGPGIPPRGRGGARAARGPGG